MNYFNKTTTYALLATGYIAQHSQKGTVEASVISKEYNIPPLYLFKVLDKLIKPNILRSKRGPGGGFSLARPAEDITLLEIIEAVDGPMFQKLEEFIDDKVFNSKIKNIFQQAREQYHEVTLVKIMKEDYEQR